MYICKVHTRFYFVKGNKQADSNNLHPLPCREKSDQSADYSIDHRHSSWPANVHKPQLLWASLTLVELPKRRNHFSALRKDAWEDVAFIVLNVGNQISYMDGDDSHS